MTVEKAAIVAPVLDTMASPKPRRSAAKNPNNYPAKTLGIFTLQNRFRRVCMLVIDSQGFGLLIMLTVLINTFAMSFANYNDPAAGTSDADTDAYTIDMIESATLVVFIVEVCMRVVAQGITGRNSYFQDNWNILDFIVILSGIVIWGYHETSSFSGIRCLRILRPLRTLRSFPGLRTLVNSLLSALPALANVAILLCFCYTVFAILGMGIWSGLLHGRCRLTEFPVRLNFSAADAPWNHAYPDDNWVQTVLTNPERFKCHDSWDVDSVWSSPQSCFWPLDPTDTVGQLCGARSCPIGTTCGSNYDRKGNPRFQDITVNGKVVFSITTEADFTANLNFGLTSFDDVGSSLVIVLQTVTASGWMALAGNTQDSFSWFGAGVYFHLVLFIGMCFLLQINMAIMVSAFEVTKVTTAADITQPPLEASFSTKRRMISTLPLGLRIKATQFQADLCNSPVGQAYHAFRRRLLKILSTKGFHRVSFCFTLVNIGTLALHQHPMPPGLSGAYLEIIQFVCLVYFVAELVMQMSAHGPRKFLQSGLNVFDFVSIVIGVVDIVSNPPAFIDGTVANSNPFIALRALRAVKLAQSWRPLKRLMLAIGRTMSEFLNFLFFLVVFVYIFALLGMELFANKFYFDSDNRPMANNGTLSPIFRHRSHFDTIDAALFTVFQIITYDNWPSVMYDGWLVVGVASPVYFISIIVLGVWIVMNMFSAITVNSVMDAVESDPATEMKRSLSKMRYLERSVSRLEIGVASKKILPAKLKDDYAMRTQHPIRFACLQLTKSKAWTTFVIFVIATASILTAFETPLMDLHVGIGQLMDDFNRMFAVLFSIEMAVELTANGLVKYVKDPWKILDALITGVSLMSWTGGPQGQGPGGLNFGVIRSFRCLRALRPLRVINQLPQLKVVVNTLFRCVPDIGKALLFLLFSLFMFGIVSVLFYQGGLSSCSISPYKYLENPTYSPLPPWFPPTYAGNFSMADLEQWDVMTFPKPWKDMADATRDVMQTVWTSSCPFSAAEAADATFQPTSKQMCLCFSLQWERVVPQSFDNVIVAMSSLYELTTMEGWANVAFAAADCTGIDSQPLPNYSPVMLVFWVAFMVFCAFFMTNLFLGILCDSFIREKYGGFLTDDQIKWVNFQRKLIAIEPLEKIPRPTAPLRQWAFDLVHCEPFDIGITVAILLNMVALAISYFGQHPTMDLALNAINYAFSMVFLFEAALKLFAVGPRQYFSRGWDRFDFFILMITIVSTVLPFVGSDKLNLGGGSMVVRVFRVGRALRLINKAKLMRSLFDTIIIALPAVGNVTGLLMLMYYIFAAVGVQLFAKVGYGPNLLNRHQNFRTFWLALQTLIGFSTGENWDNFMWELYSVTPESNPSCVDPAFNSSMCGFNDDLELCEPLDGCGSWMILPFMYLFELVVGYIGLNLFSGILVDAVADADTATSAVVMDLQDFALLWSNYDPNASCRIELDQLTLILKQMPPPLGYKGLPGYSFHRVRKELGTTGLMVYDGNFVHFREVPRALALRTVSRGNQHTFAELNLMLDDLGITKDFHRAWNRRYRKGADTLVRMEPTAPIHLHVAGLVIAGWHRRRKRFQSRQESVQALDAVDQVREVLHDMCNTIATAPTTTTSYKAT